MCMQVLPSSTALSPAPIDSYPREQGETDPVFLPDALNTDGRQSFLRNVSRYSISVRSVTSPAMECLCTWNGGAANKVCVGEIESGVAPEIGVN